MFIFILVQTREKIISDIRGVFKDSNSGLRAKWYSGQKGIENNVLANAERIKILDALHTKLSNSTYNRLQPFSLYLHFDKFFSNIINQRI